MKLCSVSILVFCVVLIAQAQLASTQDAATAEQHDAEAQDAEAQDAAAEEHAAEAQDAVALDAQDDDAVDANNDVVDSVGASNADVVEADAKLNEIDHGSDFSPLNANDVDTTAGQDAASADAQTPGSADEDAQDSADPDTSPAPEYSPSSDSTTTTSSTPAPSPTSTTPAVVSPGPREPPSNRSVAAWFRTGVEAYLSEDWKTCATALENALQEWQYFLRANIDCRLNCANEARRAAPLFDKDIEHLQHTEELVRNTLCIMKCKRRAFNGRVTTDTIAASDQKAFRDLKTYEYLQLCYYQVRGVLVGFPLLSRLDRLSDPTCPCQP